MYMCVYVCMYVYIYAYIYIYTCIHTRAPGKGSTQPRPSLTQALL